MDNFESDSKVNTYTTDYQGASSVTALADGGWVVTWESYLQDGSSFGVYGQRYNSAGAAVGSEFKVNTYTTDYQGASSVTALADGGWVVTWQSSLQDGSSGGIYGQRYDSTGGKFGSEFQVNTYTNGDQITPAVAALADGGFFVTWTSGQYESSDSPDGSSYGICARYYNADGQAYILASTSDFTQDKVLYADASLVSDRDGMGTFSWQWQRSSDGGEIWVDISGATADSYTLGDDDVGNLVRLKGSYTDGQGFENTVYSDASTTVINVNDAPVGFAVTVSGDASEDATLTASASVTSDADGLPDPLSFTYKWQSSADGSNWSDISGAASGQFTPGDAYVGLQLRVITTYTDNQGTAETAISAATAAIVNVNDAPVVANTITDQSSPENAAWMYQLPAGTFSDVDGDSLSYSATLGNGDPLPDWLTFTVASRTFSGTPPQDFNGDITLRVTASDGTLSASDTFVLTIEPPLQFVTGTAGNDTLTGVAGSVSEITGGGGNDTITGGSRANVAVYSGNRSDYTITTVAGVTTVRDNRSGSPDGTDTLKGLNILRFADIQLFQTTAANKMTLAGQAQTYEVANSEVVQGTNAAEHFIVAPKTSALVFAGNNDVVDLSGAIDSYTFSKTGTQLQISDGIYTTTLSVGGTFTLRTASGSTSVAIDYTQGGAIKLGGGQIVGSASFDPIAAILDAGNVPSTATPGSLQTVTGTSGNDTLTGIAGSVSEITGGGGNDTITGGSRADAAVYSGNRSDYTITTVAGVTTVVDNRAGSPDGTDTLKGMNILRFADIQLFQTTAANKMTLAGQAQTYEVANSEVVQGTNAAEHFIIAPRTSALVFAGNNDVVDLAGAIDSYTFSKTGTQLQISDGIYTTTLSVGGSFTLRTASGSTRVAIDYTQGGAIKLGGTQIVGSASFAALDAITDHSNFSDNAVFGDVNVTDGHTYYARAGEADVFLVDAAQALTATIVGFEAGDRIVFENRTIIDGAAFDQGTINDGIATIAAGSATITLDSLANDNFGAEVSFENIYGANAIGYVI